MNNALIVYSSSTGNTEKVAYAIQEGLEKAGVKVLLKKPEDAQSVDFFDYDLVCVGSPSIQWHPSRAIDDFLKGKLSSYRHQDVIKPNAPKVHGKYALIFCTYSGPHTGLAEAEPAGKYMSQFFEHLGFTVIDEWYIVGEFHGSEENSTKGRLGDIRGKPTKQDLLKLKEAARQLANKY